MTNSNDLARRVAALLSAPPSRPLPERELAKQLQLAPGQRGLLRQILRELQSAGRAAPFEALQTLLTQAVCKSVNS